MINNAVFYEALTAPVRALRGRVEFYTGSELALMCGCHDALKSVTVERAGEEGKFFGFGVCQKINVHLVDVERAINISTANTAEVVFGSGSSYIYPYPIFHVTEVHRDESTNELSVTAYDALYKAAEHTVAELTLPSSYTLADFARACGALLGLPLNDVDSAFDELYEDGANLDGTETLREALNAVAEATQTVYYVDRDWRLTFKRLDITGAPALTIDREQQYTLESGDNRRLSQIVHATELGDNVSAALAVSGSTQYVRNNPFWELRDHIGELVDSALDRVGGLTINQFSCKWRGNFLLELGDKIELVTKDGGKVTAYALNDSLNFDGSLQQESVWRYVENETETADNPSNLGDALKQTYARVDKANRQIALVASEAEADREQLAALQLSTSDITATVQRVEAATAEALAGVNDELDSVTSKVEAAVTADAVTIAIQTELAKGAEKVVTSTGFSFDESGLSISKSGSEMTTAITEDGMTVYRDAEAVLTADNTGVDATNLRATTYLIVGSNSRFEDYGSDRTGCFWIGGN